MYSDRANNHIRFRQTVEQSNAMSCVSCSEIIKHHYPRLQVDLISTRVAYALKLCPAIYSTKAFAHIALVAREVCDRVDSGLWRVGHGVGQRWRSSRVAVGGDRLARVAHRRPEAREVRVRLACIVRLRWAIGLIPGIASKVCRRINGRKRRGHRV